MYIYYSTGWYLLYEHTKTVEKFVLLEKLPVVQNSNKLI